MSQSPNLSVISHFYNGHEWVDKQIAHWMQIKPQLKHLFEFILVDDFSDSEYILPQNDLNMRLFRVTEDIPWNQGGARNLGAFNAKGEAGLFIDIDQYLYIEFLERLCTSVGNLERNTLNFFRIKELTNTQNNQQLLHHPNAFVVNLMDFKVKGLYDEDFCGNYGFEDVFLVRAWQKNGGDVKLINEIVSENLPFGTKDLNRDVTRNQELINEKVFSHQCRRSKSILRFSWEEVGHPQRI
jgi:glycosyltransferase involved in cell wall biosynthesis